MPPLVNGKRPAIVAACMNSDRLLAELSALATFAEAPQAKTNLERLWKTSLAGIDKTRPLGLYCQPTTYSLGLVGFLPLKDKTVFKQALTETYGRPTEVDENSWKFTTFSTVISGDWIYLAERLGELKNLPTDPSKLLVGLPQQHTVVVRLDPFDVPATKKKEVLKGIRKSLTQTDSVERDTAEEITKTIGNYATQYLMDFVDGTHVIEFGISTDTTTHKANVDFKFVPAAGSSVAEQLATPLPPALPLDGFDQPQALLHFRRAAVVSPSDRAFEAQLFKQVLADETARLKYHSDLTEAEKKECLDSITRWRPLMQVVLGDEFIQQAVVVLPSNDPSHPEYHAILGFAGSRSKATTDAFKAFVNELKHDQRSLPPTVNFDIAEVDGVKFHEITTETHSAPKPPSVDTTIRNLIGSARRTIVGTAPGRFYLAVGPKADVHLRTLLQSATNAPGTSSEALKLELSATHLVSLLSRTHGLRLPNRLEIERDRYRQTDRLKATATRSAQQWTMKAELEPGMLLLVLALAEKAVTPVEPLIPLRFRTRFGLP
jgi:hypothetical protein